MVVNPTPVLTSSQTPSAICNNGTFSYTATSATSGVSFVWTRAVVAGISNGSGSGSSAAVSEVLTNTTTDPISVVYRFTLTANGCSNTQDVTVVVNPTPLLTSSQTPTAICSGSTFTYSATSATVGTTYSWSRAAITGISNVLGSGSSASVTETLINTSASPISVVYRFTLTANGCSNTQDVTVIVNPKPLLTSSLTPAAICNNGTFTYQSTSATAGVTFSWSRAVVVGISNASGSDNSASISEVLTNTTASPISVVYKITLAANGCSNVQDVTVVVNPTPLLTSSLSPPAICSGTSFSYTATSSTSGVSFSWSRASVTGISNTASSGSTSAISEILTNTTAAPIDVTYVISLSANGCSNPLSYSVVVRVNPKPILNSGLTPTAICLSLIHI